MSRRVLAFIAVLAIVAIVGGPTLLDRTPLGEVDGIALPSLGLDLPSLGTSADPESEPTPSATPVPVPGHEVYGFVPYWEMNGDIVDHVRGTKLTTLGLFSVTACALASPKKRPFFDSPKLVNTSSTRAPLSCAARARRRPTSPVTRG